MKALGHHLILELYGCSPTALSSVAQVQEVMLKAARGAGATVIDSIFHSFKPYGVSGVVVIAQSHFAIHTWPAHRYASADLFTCGESIKPWKALNAIKKLFKASRFSVVTMERGFIAKDSAAR